MTDRKYRLHEDRQSILKYMVRTVPNHPVRGVEFKDVSDALADPEHRHAVIKQMVIAVNSMLDHNVDPNLTRVLSIESRGAWFAGAIADQIGCRLHFVRKADKAVPGAYSDLVETKSEYGSTKFALPWLMPTDGMNIILIDDVLATGGTALELAKRLRGRYNGAMCNPRIGLVTMVEVTALGGRSKLCSEGFGCESVLQY